MPARRLGFCADLTQAAQDTYLVIDVGLIFDPIGGD